MQAIKTEFFGATNTQPSKIVATTGAGIRLVVKYDDSVTDMHLYAAHKMMAKMGWSNEIIGGGLKDYQVWVMIPNSQVTHATLVYQAGLANVFHMILSDDPSRKVRRLEQGTFRTCEDFARGLQAAGVKVGVAYCNKAGDIANVAWDTQLEDAPFRDKFNFKP